MNPTRTCRRCGEVQEKVRGRWILLVAPSYRPGPHRHLWGKSSDAFKRGTVFRHGRILDPAWTPGPGQRYADAPKALCRVTAIRSGLVLYGIGENATHALYRTDPARLLADGAEVVSL